MWSGAETDPVQRNYGLQIKHKALHMHRKLSKRPEQYLYIKRCHCVCVHLLETSLLDMYSASAPHGSQWCIMLPATPIAVHISLYNNSMTMICLCFDSPAYSLPFLG